MRVFLKIFAVMSVSCVCVVGPGMQSLQAETVLGGTPFSTGETVSYTIKKMAMKAGTAKTVFNGPAKWKGQDVFLVTFTAIALNFSDEEKIYLGIHDLYPVAVERNLDLWGKKEKIIEEYDTQRGRVVITKEAGGKKTQQVIEKKGRLDNLYGFIYRYRMSGRFKPGETLRMNLPTQEVQLKVVRQEPMTVAGVRHNALYLESTPAKYRIWFDSSSERVPLRIDGAVGFGNTAMIMREYKK